VHRRRLICLLLALITLLLYLPAWRCGFLVFDDPEYVTENRNVNTGLTWTGIRWAFTSWQESNWTPLASVSHMLDCELFGLNAGAHHLVNVLFHVANSVLILLVIYRMTNRLWPSALVAALFAWHPLHVESVAWVAERKDVLSAFFFAMTLWFYAAYVKQNRKINFWIAWLFFLLGLLTKPMLVTLPFLLLLLDFWPLGRAGSFGPQPSGSGAGVTQSEKHDSRLRILVLEKWPFFLLSLASSAVTILAAREDALISLDKSPLILRIGNALVAYFEYVVKTVCPTGLAVVYPAPKQISMVHLFAAVLFMAAISFYAWQRRRTSPHLLVGWLWFIGTLTPVIGVVQFGGHLMADRYTYIPLIGIFIAVAVAAFNWAAGSRRRFAVVASASSLCLMGCLILTSRQLSFWRDSEKLFSHAVAVTKNNPIARINLGVALEQQGRREEAIAQYREALRIDPGRVQAHNNLGNLLDEAGRTQEALAEFREALRLNPKAALAHANLGTTLARLGRFDDAMREYAEAARLKPDDPRWSYLMGKACLRERRSAQAVRHFEDALRLDPNHLTTLVHLARTLASDGNSNVRNGTRAVELAQRANMLTGGEDAFVLDTLAMALAEAGRFDDARRIVQQAIDVAGREGEEEVREMRLRLQLYDSRLPYREAGADVSPK